MLERASCPRPPIRGVDDPVARQAKLAGRREGYDADYRDAEGRIAGQPGFLPPRKHLQVACFQPHPTA